MILEYLSSTSLQCLAFAELEARLPRPSVPLAEAVPADLM